MDLFGLALEAPRLSGLVDFDNSIFVQLGLFLLLVFVLDLLIFKPYKKVLETREKRMVGDRERAEEIRHKSAHLVAEYETKISAGREEALRGKNVVKEEGQTEATKILSQAKDEASEKLDRGRKEAEEEAEDVRKEFDVRSEALAESIMEKITHSPMAGGAGEP